MQGKPPVSYPDPVEGFNLYRSTGAGTPFARIPPGGPLPPSTGVPTYTDLGAVAPPPVYWYQARAVDACGAESAE